VKLALVLALVSAPAYAGHHSCGHSSGGGGGGGSYSSGSSSSSSSGSSSESHTCTETTDVEGYRECVGFGVWADNMTLPHMMIVLGTNMRQFSTRIGSESGSVTHGDETFAYRVAMPASVRRSEMAVTASAQFELGFGHGFYAGLEGEIGGLVAPEPLSTEMLSTGTWGSPMLDLQGGMVVGGGGVVGLRGGTSRFAVAAEIAGGVRDVEYRFDSTYHDCEQTSMIDVMRGVLEARARAEVWVYPWVSFGASVGRSVIDGDDWMAGAYVGLHSRAYGGLR
jgi:hypothetical protein